MEMPTRLIPRYVRASLQAETQVFRLVMNRKARLCWLSLGRNVSGVSVHLATVSPCAALGGVVVVCVRVCVCACVWRGLPPTRT